MKGGDNIIQEHIYQWLISEQRPVYQISKSTGISQRTLSNYLNDTSSRSTLKIQERMIYASNQAILIVPFTEILMNYEAVTELMKKGFCKSDLKYLATNEILKVFNQEDLDKISMILSKYYGEVTDKWIC